MVTEADLTEFLKKNAPAKQFVPYMLLCKEADTLTAYFDGDPDYSKRLNDHITIYLSLETDEIVGCRIKGISSILADLPNFIRVNHKDVELSVLFWAFRGQADEIERETINNLAKVGMERQLVLDTHARG